jgi:hypothetical protein
MSKLSTAPNSELFRQEKRAKKYEGRVMFGRWVVIIALVMFPCVVWRGLVMWGESQKPILEKMYGGSRPSLPAGVVPTVTVGAAQLVASPELPAAQIVTGTVTTSPWSREVRPTWTLPGRVELPVAPGSIIGTREPVQVAPTSSP